MVEARSIDGTARQGSAVAIGRDTLITNCHVTRRAATIVVVQGSVARRATVLAGSGELDLCVLSAATAGMRAPRIRSAATVAVGDPVHAVGYPVGHGITIRSGTITAMHQYDNSSVIQVSAPIDFGASGGGLFDRHGNLVGVLAFKMLGGGGHYFALPADWIPRVVDQPAPLRVGARYDDALAFWERSPGALPPFLERLALDPGGSHGAGTSAATTSGKRR